MADFDLVMRAPRVITKAGEVSRCVAVRDGVVVAIEPLEAELEGEETVELADDEVLLPGLVDTPCARQRPRPHRVGGLRDRHPRGGGRRHHDPPRHAAQLPPADHHGGGP